jgi:RNA polymerase sigma factor (TIGR02999 family)
MLPDSEQVTTLLQNWRQGNADARDQLLAVVYNELHALASRYLRSERRDHTLQPTALVNELYVRVFTKDEPITWQNRTHFFAVAAQTLRRILVDHARAHQAEKRGGAQIKLSLTAAQGWAEGRAEDFVALDEALDRLAQLEPRSAQVVELRFFGGLQENEIAEVLGVSPITVKRDWKLARAWLLSQMLPSGLSRRT